MESPFDPPPFASDGNPSDLPSDVRRRSVCLGKRSADLVHVGEGTLACLFIFFYNFVCLFCLVLLAFSPCLFLIVPSFLQDRLLFLRCPVRCPLLVFLALFGDPLFLVRASSACVL